MYYSQYVATKLELWKEHQQRSLETRNSERLGTTNKLLTLLAKMGIPLEQAEQKYMHMKTQMKNRLLEKLVESDELTREFNLNDIVCQTFRKERKNCAPIAANQCVEICQAMMCLPDPDAVSPSPSTHTRSCCACTPTTARVCYDCGAYSRLVVRLPLCVPVHMVDDLWDCRVRWLWATSVDPR